MSNTRPWRFPAAQAPVKLPASAFQLSHEHENPQANQEACKTSILRSALSIPQGEKSCPHARSFRRPRIGGMSAPTEKPAGPGELGPRAHALEVLGTSEGTSSDTEPAASGIAEAPDSLIHSRILTLPRSTKKWKVVLNRGQGSLEGKLLQTTFSRRSGSSQRSPHAQEKGAKKKNSGLLGGAC